MAMKRFLALFVAVLAVSSSAATVPTDDRAIVHVLSRMGFGARPGDVERIRTLGIQRYIDEQLHPDDMTGVGEVGQLGGDEQSGNAVEHPPMNRQMRDDS